MPQTRENKAPRRSSRTWPTRPAIREAAEWENKPVSEFIRAAIAVRAEQGFCKAASDGDQAPGGLRRPCIDRATSRSRGRRKRN